jgi:hypothetical protein
MEIFITVRELRFCDGVGNDLVRLDFLAGEFFLDLPLELFLRHQPGLEHPSCTFEILHVLACELREFQSLRPVQSLWILAGLPREVLADRHQVKLAPRLGKGRARNSSNDFRLSSPQCWPARSPTSGWVATD